MQPPLIQFDPIHDPAPAPSPCTGVCELKLSTGLCDGCQRDVDEIMGWGQATDAHRRLIWQRIIERRKITEQPTKRRGNR